MAELADLTDDMLIKLGFDRYTMTLSLGDGNTYFGKDSYGRIRLIHGEYYVGRPIITVQQLKNIFDNLSYKEPLCLPN